MLRPAGGASFGGDFVVSVCDGKMLEVAVVDVSGKGIDAGTRALMLSGAFGGLLGSVPASEFLTACNAYLRRSEPAEGFVTAVHLALDLTTGNYVIGSAGHPPAAHFESGSGLWLLTQARGIVLGVVPDLRQDAEHGTLRPGDALMLYTDGVVEQPGRDIDVGIDRLLGEADHLVTGGFGGGAASLVQAMRDGTGAHRRLRAGAYLAEVTWPPLLILLTACSTRATRTSRLEARSLASHGISGTSGVRFSAARMVASG